MKREGKTIIVKWIGRLFKLAIVLLVVGAIFYNVTARFLLTLYLRSLLGAPVQIENIRLDFLNSQVKISDIHVRNPAGFPEGTLVRIPKIFADLELFRLLRGELYFHTLEIDCRDVRVIRGEDGRLNWLSLKVLDRSRSKVKESPPPPSSRPKLFIQNFVLSLGFATYTDLFAPQPLQKSFNLRVDHAVYRNVDSIQEVVGMISWEITKRMGISSAVSGVFQSLGKEGISSPQGFWGKTAATLKEKLS